MNAMAWNSSCHTGSDEHPKRNPDCMPSLVSSVHVLGSAVVQMGWLFLLGMTIYNLHQRILTLGGCMLECSIRCTLLHVIMNFLSLQE